MWILSLATLVIVVVLTSPVAAQYRWGRTGISFAAGGSLDGNPAQHHDG